MSELSPKAEAMLKILGEHCEEPLDLDSPGYAECRAKLLPLALELFDAGLITICPPGERYKLNASGRAMCGGMQAAERAA